MRILVKKQFRIIIDGVETLFNPPESWVEGFMSGEECACTYLTPLGRLVAANSGCSHDLLTNETEENSPGDYLDTLILRWLGTQDIQLLVVRQSFTTPTWGIAAISAED